LVTAGIAWLTPPDFMRDVPRAVTRVLDPSDAFRFALGLLDPGRWGGLIIAFDGVQSYFEAAKRQQRRIERAKTRVLKRTRVDVRPIFDEVHFYLICWARIAKLGRFIVQQTRFSRTGRVLRRHAAQFKERISARDHLEHFEERLPGGAKEDKLAIRGDLLNMRGNFLTYGGEAVDIGPASLQLLKVVVTEFRTAVLYDSLDALARDDPRGLDAVFRRAATDVQVARALRRVRRMLRTR
jgi:hypothetical protein